MERRPTIIVCMTYSIGCCIDEELNNIDCHMFVATCKLERCLTEIISSTCSGRKIFEKASNYPLGDSLIDACPKEELIIAHMTIIIGCQLVSLDNRASLLLKVKNQNCSTQLIPLKSMMQQIADYYCRSRSWSINRDWAKMLGA
eukprot:scaffold9295_cov75-Skeletonema_dohrnii-CCMP3373.AAC.6